MILELIGMDLCNDQNVLKVVSVLIKLYSIACILIPVILIILISIDIFKAVVSSDNDALKNSLKASLKRIVSAIIVFFLPYFTRALVSVLNTEVKANLKISTCFKNADNFSYYQKYQNFYNEKKTWVDFEQEKAEEALKAKIAEEQRIAAQKAEEERQRAKTEAERIAAEKKAEEARKKAEEAKKKAEEDARKAKEAEDAKKSGDKVDDDKKENPSEEGGNVGKTYNLSDKELNFLAYVAQKEQGGNLDGAAAEASLMVNRYELLVNKSKFPSLYSYVRNSGWWSNTKNGNSDGKKPRDDVKATVKSVIQLGNRALLPYVDEHDCHSCNRKRKCLNGIKGDICVLETNGTQITSSSGVANKNNYVSKVTKLYTVYGMSNGNYSEYYTFYKFPCNKCDPFGYTPRAKNRYDSLNGG